LAFSLSMWDLSLWLAASSIVLLVTSEVLLELIGENQVRVDRTRVRIAGFVVAILFLITIALRIFEVVF
jgi:hypothetical protein